MRGDVQRGLPLPLPVGLVGQLRLLVEQQLHHLRVVLLRRVVQRVVAVGICQVQQPDVLLQHDANDLCIEKQWAL